jgi:electron transport complex protein RnfB
MSKTLQVVTINEAACIGCTKCIAACPVDAIVGANKQSHSVLTDLCIGCELCLPPCPVNCIEIVPLAALSHDERQQRVSVAKHRVKARKARLKREADQKQLADKAIINANIKALITASLARSQLKQKTHFWGVDDE